MIKGALSTTGNINVGVALSIFEKQITPVLTYGSIYWGLSDNFDIIYIKNIPESI